jgi:hypothetical protein
VPAESRKIRWARRAGVDERRRAAPAGDGLGFDADGRPAPVDVGVKVDHPRRHDRSRDVALVLGGLGNPRRHCRHAAVREAHVARCVESLGRVDHPAPTQDQIHRLTLHSVISFFRSRTGFAGTET